MLRAVLAVVLAVALVGAAVPAIERARDRRAANLAEGQLSLVAERATGLATAEEATADGAARRVVSVAVPDDGIVTSALEFLAVGGVPDCGTPRDTAAGDVVAYRLKGGPTRVRHLPVDLRVVTGGRVREDDDPLVLEGDARLTLSLVRDGDERRVHVQRGAGDDAEVTDGVAG